MANEVKITKISLQLGRKTVELSVDEARKLKESLDEVFGKQVVHNHYPYQPYIWWSSSDISFYTTTYSGSWDSNTNMDTLTIHN